MDLTDHDRIAVTQRVIAEAVEDKGGIQTVTDLVNAMAEVHRRLVISEYSDRADLPIEVVKEMAEAQAEAVTQDMDENFFIYLLIFNEYRR